MQGNYAHNTYITTDCQTNGRGQRGNRWESTPGENLTFSLVITPTHIPVVEQYRISMMAALAASDAIGSLGVRCNIKWSNDLYVGDNKIGGILIEHTLMGELLTKSVIGIGINVLQTQFPLSLPNPTSLVRESATVCSPEQLLEIFARHFEARYLQDSQTLHRDYMDRLWRRDGFFDYFDPLKGDFKARVVDVDPLVGVLTLATDQGEQRDYWFKEVEFRL